MADTKWMASEEDGSKSGASVQNSASRPQPAQSHAGLQRLLLVLFAGGLVQILIRIQDWAQNPLSHVPRVDAAHNWEWASRIAGGELIGDVPFFGAPLAPYVAGLLRALGGGLLAWQVLGVVFLMGAAALVGRAAMRAFGGALAPALAAGLVLLTTDCAHAPGRVLSGPLQLLLMAWVLERVVACLLQPDMRRALWLGAAAGVTTLAWPVMLPLTMLLALWVAWVAGARAGIGAALMALVCIAPATLHNLAASGDLIPVTAHAGVTFYHGNNPRADGTITGSGLSMDKSAHQREALEQTREALGPEAGWSDVSGYFFSRGFEWWVAEPSRALGLALRKGSLFLAGRHYGDIDLVTLERGEVLSTLWLAFLPSQLVVALGILAGLMGLRRNPRIVLPALLLILAAMGVVVIFWYTPRYRLPVVPAASFLIAGAVANGAMNRRTWKIGMVTLVGLSMVFSRTGWDDANRWRSGFHLALAQAHMDMGSLGAARDQARLSEEAWYLGGRYRDQAGGPRAAILLAELMGGPEGLAELLALADKSLGDGDLQRRAGIGLAEAERLPEALIRFEAAARLDPLDWRARQGWGAALLQSGEGEQAAQILDGALALAPREPDVLYTRGLAAEMTGDDQRALEWARETLVHGPRHQQGRDLLVRQLLKLGLRRELVELLEAWLEETPDLWPARSLCAWVLATAADETLRDGKRALALLNQQFPDPPNPDALDTLAAAFAAAGDFEAAQGMISKAITLSGDWPDEMRAGLLERQASYTRREVWIEAP